MSTEQGASGLVWNVLFAHHGYTPHCAEHLVDPLDGREKLLLFDPHTFFGVILYDPSSQRSDWEFQVPGDGLNNPHQGFMLRDDVKGFGSKGDIVCPDRDNNIIVISRATKTVTFHKKPSIPGIQWLHCLNRATDGSLIVTDYVSHRISKLSVPDLREMWSRTDIIKPSKIMPIEGRGLAHDPSFGGDYTIASNVFGGPVYELRDSDGSTAWSSQQEGVLCDIASPHGCFRMGRVEGFGPVTMVHGEGDGAIVGLNYEGIPVFGFMPASAWEKQDGTIRYDFNPYLLGEITCLFPTVHGNTGFCAWHGVNLSVVGEITHFPSKQRVSYRLRSGTTQDTVDWLPLVHTASWDETAVVIKNTGCVALQHSVDAYMAASPRLQSDPDSGRLPAVLAGKVGPGEHRQDTVSGIYSSIRIGVKSASAGQGATCEVWVTQKRG